MRMREKDKLVPPCTCSTRSYPKSFWTLWSSAKILRWENLEKYKAFGAETFFFDAFSTVHTETIWMRCYLDPLSRALSNRCLFYESAGPSSVNGRPKRIERYAFSNENILMLAGQSFDGMVNYLKSSSAFVGAVRKKSGLIRLAMQRF